LLSILFNESTILRQSLADAILIYSEGFSPPTLECQWLIIKLIIPNLLKASPKMEKINEGSVILVWQMGKVASSMI